MQALSFSPRLFPSTHRQSLPPATSFSIGKSCLVSSPSLSLPAFSQCRAVQSPHEVAGEVKFMEASQLGNVIPLHRVIFADHLTPVLAYRCLVKEDDREAPSFLFESVQPGRESSSVGRYSVVGSHPAMEIVAKDNTVTIMDHEEGRLTEKVVDDPMEVPRSISEEWRPQLIDDLPDAFCGGWVGYFSYDTVRYSEKKKVSFSKAPLDDRNLADIHLGLYDDVIVFDHVEKKAFVIHWVRLDRYESVQKAYQDGMDRLEALASKVQDVVPPRLSPGAIELCTHQFGDSLKKANMTKDEFKNAVIQAKEHILSGDIFQIVLSQRFERRTFADPFEVYRALRVVNPSPYMTYLQARGCILVSSSPEILTSVKKQKIVNRPLAGTTRRGKTSKEDKMQEMQLLNDEKQCAEHIMLVDLGRNDVGKISKSGSVNVEKLMTVERYSHVMHISSTVTGELLDHLSSWDALRAALPVGTVSGAPKDAEQRQEWVAYLQAGAGIVADSTPEDEHQECENKAAGLARAIDLAESAFLS
uniref:anthranilate synthase n=1 Tax=Daucus carota subsp. sativus TaxID=79200 RepID=A0A161WWF7_DAUCS